MSNFAYSVAIKLSVANLASQGIKLIASDLMTAHGAASNLQNKLSALKTTAVGYGLNSIGGGVLGFLEKSVNASKEYTRQLSLMNASGMTQVDIAEATAAAWKTSKDVITSSAAENLSAIRELRSVFGKDHMHEAYSILPTVQRTKAIMEALSGKEQHGVAFDMVKAIELRNTGTMSAAQMQKNADMMAQTLMAFGGTINVHDYHMALKQAKTSGMRLNDDFVFKYMPTLMQEVKTGSGGAQSAGSILETMRRAVAGGRIPEKMIGNWQDAGLVAQSGIGHGGAGNRYIKPGSVAGTELFLSNPYQWANEYAEPAVAKLMKKRRVGFDTATAMLFGDRNAEFGLSTFIKKAAQFERDKRLVEGENNSYNTYQKLLKSNPQLAEQAMHSQWQNVQARLGYEILPRLIPYMIKFADGLDKISQWMQQHGTATTAIALGLGGIGIGLSIIGKVLMTVGMIKFLGLGPTLSGMVPSLANVSTGLGVLAKAAGVFMAAYAGWKAGGWLNENAINPAVKKLTGGKNHSLGDLVYDRTHTEEGRFAWWRMMPAGDLFENKFNPVAPASNSGNKMINNTIVMPDGQVLAKVMTKEMDNELRRPTAGTSRFDGNRSPAPVGMNWRR